MKPESSISVNNNEEVSIRELILKVSDWLRFLCKRWRLIMLFVFLGGTIGLVCSFLLKPKYIAEMTFVLEDNNTNPLGAYLGLAGQFGIDLSGGSNSGVFAGDNIIEFLKSRLMIEKALLSGTISQNGKTISLADYYIEIYEMRKNWSEKPTLKELHFPLNVNRNVFSLQQDSILNIIQTRISDGALVVEKIDKKLSFISVKCAAISEKFSKYFVQELVKNAIDFYITTKTKQNKVNVDRLQIQADSLRVLLNNKTYSAAIAQDLNSNPARQVAGVRTEVELRDKMVLQAMFGEVVKNLELSKIAMAQETPLIQIVDTPILPLEKKRLGKIKGIVLGGFLAGFITIFLLTIRKIYMVIMST